MALPDMTNPETRRRVEDALRKWNDLTPAEQLDLFRPFFIETIKAQFQQIKAVADAFVWNRPQ
jgi:delta-aminolevulinic acid dehydratase/porphobilinogen synthase